MEIKNLIKEKEYTTQQLDSEKRKTSKLTEEKRLLLDEFKKLDKIKKYVRDAQHADKDRSD